MMGLVALDFIAFLYLDPAKSFLSCSVVWILQKRWTSRNPMFEVGLRATIYISLLRKGRWKGHNNNLQLAYSNAQSCLGWLPQKILQCGKYF